jgi:manganese/zinc/iron transport system substrate-binding protein
MMNKFLTFLFCIACVLSMLVFFRANHVPNDNHTFTIVATTSMLADAVSHIVGDQIVVHGLMGPGIDPHLYRTRESDVHKLAAADMVIYNGLHLEGKMGQVLEGMNRFTTVVNVSDALDTTLLREADFEGLYDPHIWFDVSLWISVVQYIQEQIMQLDPDHVLIYQKNGDEYIAQLQSLHEYVKKRINEIIKEKRILITAHDAFGYFGKAYGFTVVGLQGLSTDSDISIQDIQEMADYIANKKIPVIFIESSIPERSIIAVQNAVKAQGWDVTIGEEIYSDALGDEVSGAASYIDMVKYNIDVIVDALVA